jgi:hypothetical protein
MGVLDEVKEQSETKEQNSSPGLESWLLVLNFF